MDVVNQHIHTCSVQIHVVVVDGGVSILNHNHLFRSWVLGRYIYIYIIVILVGYGM